MIPARAQRLLDVLEGLHLTADDLQHLAVLARQRERERAEQHTADLAQVMWDKPTIGAIRRAQREKDTP